MATGEGIASQLPADGAAVDPQLPGDPSLAHVGVRSGMNLIPLGLGQLSALLALLHFVPRAEEGRRWSSRLYLLLQKAVVIL